MKLKEGSATEWIIFSVLSVIVPVIFAFILSSIINKKFLDLSDIIDSVILVAFSIACSLLSICRNVMKQKKDICTIICYWISSIITFASWTVYIISLTKNLPYLNIVCICALIISSVCIVLGIFLERKSDKNENEVIIKMHTNCNKLRATMISSEHNASLYPFVKRNNDLLCNPNEFDRVEAVLRQVKYNKNDDNKS